MFPLTFGLQYYILKDKLTDSFKPYFSAGAGPTLILSTPYEKEFFNSFGYGTFYGRFGGFVGLGANLGANSNSLLGLNLKYYFIPFGGKGIESIQDFPMKDLGGVFLSLTVGTKY
jgi:outer membrane protein W